MILTSKEVSWISTHQISSQEYSKDLASLLLFPNPAFVLLHPGCCIKYRENGGISKAKLIHSAVTPGLATKTMGYLDKRKGQSLT